jgi:hypothetical protein
MNTSDMHLKVLILILDIYLHVLNGDNIKMDLQEVGGGCGDWMERAQDRDRWRALEYGNELWGSTNAGNFLTSCKTS